MTPPYINGGMTAATIAKNNATRKPAPKPAPKPVAKQPAQKPVPKPLNPQAQYINDAVNRLGTPLTDAQIQTNASGQLSPIIAALTASIGRQASAGTQAISGYTSNLQQQLAPFQQSAANIYGGAEQSQAASDAALSAKLQGEGGQQAQDLGARLASINAPGATNAAVGQATTDATGAGNALYGTGSASLANLIAAGAAEQSYAGKLPGIAGLAGLQQTGSLQAQLSGKLADQTGELQAKVPDIVAGLQGQRSDLVNRRETLRQGLTGDLADAAAKRQALAQERQALGLKTKVEKTRLNQTQQRIGISKQNALTSAKSAAARERISQQNADTSALRDERNYRLGLQRIGISNKSLQLRAINAAKKEKKGGFTPSQIEAFHGKAYTIADDSAHGYTVTTNGTPTPVAPVSAKEAMRRMLRAGIPPDVAHAAVKRFYPKPKPFLIYGPPAPKGK